MKFQISKYSQRNKRGIEKVSEAIDKENVGSNSNVKKSE